MDVEYPVREEEATLEYVLAVLRDEHRQQCRYDPEADAEVSLSFATTVKAWREACDLLEWRPLGRALNRTWEINCSDVEWRAVLEPEGRRTLAHVCELIARHARRPCIRPATVLGCNGLAAGAFLTIRSLLQEAGAPAEAITPSTSLTEYARRYSRVFLLQISRLAPGALPLVRVQAPLYYAALWAMVIAWLGLLVGLIVGAFSGFHILTIGSGSLFLLSYGLIHIAAKLPPARVEFGELRTFRDLAVLIADQLT
jgi:hypothetical protein